MAQQNINLGNAPNDGSGDTLRTGGTKINANFTELYAGQAAQGEALVEIDADKFDKTGGAISGDVDMTGNNLTNLPVPAGPTEPVRKQEFAVIEAKLPEGYGVRAAAWALLDSAKRKLRWITPRGIGISNIPERFTRDVQFTGGVSASFGMAGNRIEGLGDPDSDDDAVSRGYVNTLIGGKLSTAGGALTGPLSMGGFALTNLPAPVNPGDSVRLAEFSPISLKLPVQYGARSGVAWALIDAAKRKLRFIDRQGIGWSNIPERFNKGVQFLSTVSFTGRVAFSQLLLGEKNIDFLTGYSDRTGYIRAYVDSNRRVLFGLRRSGSAWAFGKQLATTKDVADAFASVTPTPNYIPPLLKPADGFAEAWGDSLTAGTGGTAWALQLATLIGGGFSAAVNGYGGRTSIHIAARMGATLTTVNVAGGQLLGNGGSTVINNVSTNLLWYPSAGAQSEAGRIIGIGAGVHGTLTGTTDGSNTTTYAFVSDAGQPTIIVPDGALFIPDRRYSVTRDRELWICVGRNNYSQPEQVKSDVAAMIGLARKTHKRIMLFGVINGNYGSGPGIGEYVGGSGWSTIRQLNFDLRKLYPAYYAVDSQGRDLRERLVASYNTGVAQDITDFGNDIPPSSLRSDNIHLNTAGYGVWAQLAYEFRQANIV